MTNYRRNYKKQVWKMQVDMFPTDKELIDWLQNHKPIATTIKNLIKDAIENEKKSK